jgi:hypothetical protein
LIKLRHSEHLHGIAIARPRPANSALDIILEQFIRVELGRVTGRKNISMRSVCWASAAPTGSHVHQLAR